MLSERDLLAYFSDALTQLKYNHSYKVGYFLSKLGEFIDSKMLYSIFFSQESHLALINKSYEYLDCLFFLYASQRQNFNHYFMQTEPFQRLLNGDYDARKVFNWLEIFGIRDGEIVLFLDQRIPREKFSTVLLESLREYDIGYLEILFQNRKALTSFLIEYIGKELLIAELEFGYLPIKNMFDTPTEFYDFISDLPFNKKMCYLRSYLSRFKRDESAAFVLKELNDFSSHLFQQLCAEEEHSRWIVELLCDYCDEKEITSYLSAPRPFLTAEQIETLLPKKPKSEMHIPDFRVKIML